MNTYRNKLSGRNILICEINFKKKSLSACYRRWLGVTRDAGEVNQNEKNMVIGFSGFVK